MESSCRLCERPIYVKKDQLCSVHYNRKIVHGDPSVVLKRGKRPWVVKWLRERFEADDTDECFGIPRRRINTYSVVKYGGGQIGAHVLVCEWANGAKPPPHPTEGPYEVAHSCKQRRDCVNRRHLRWDTRKRNQHDEWDHGTKVKGEATHNSKLTEDDVRAIRADGRKQRDVAADYGVSQATICRIKRRLTWAWLE